MSRSRFRRLIDAAKAAMGLSLLAATVLVVGEARTALVVPTDIQQPGSQPGEVANLESPNKCDNCHGGYNTATEPAHNWRGSMMANAARDPLFWATVAIAEQDFNGSGDLCIRCHSPPGWQGGRSTPTDGSALTTADAEGVTCDSCHKMTNPSNTEHLGVMNPPFVANDGGNPATGYYGSGQLSLSGGTAKLGPYAATDAPHQFTQSRFHRDARFCGSCHDVSNPAVGNLAHNNGQQPSGVGSVIANYVLGGAVDGKAAFNNFPYQYGVIERTFSEHMSGSLSQTLVSAYPNLPADLKAGSIQLAYQGAGGNYADGAPRYFSCQTCHMRAITGQGCNKNPPVRSDLPLHDLTGGNIWVPDAILYQNTQGTLRLGGGLTADQISAIGAGKARALANLQNAATLSISGNTLKVVNLTGHKLITGYPEGRRMWVNTKWYDSGNALLREDGRYGNLAVAIPGVPATVRTILDLDGTNTRIYEAHNAMTQEWASQLLSLGHPGTRALAYDRVTGNVTLTLGQLAAQAPGTHGATFHFVLNNTIVKDNRIPTYGMGYDTARVRNALPVPDTQYGNPGPGGTYRYWDEVALDPPAGADHASISLLYQTTSWEYIQFLFAANDGSSAFLANEGVNLLNAWVNTGMAEPAVMASTTWTAPRVLTVAKGGTGDGTVVSTPAGIDCGPTCTASFAQGSVVTLVATASATFAFAGWGGACAGSGNCAVTMDTGKSVVATFNSTAAPPVLQAVRSRKTHGAAGLFELSIDTSQPVSGNVTVEPRIAGAGHKVVFQFNRAISSPGTATCTDANGAAFGSVNAEAVGSDVEVTISGLPDNVRATISLANVSGSSVNASAALGFLAGDVDGTRRVTASDILRGKGRSGQAAASGNFVHDVDLSGLVDATDLALEKAGSGRSL
jgi:hypothetical protein